jgi:phage baseplate assembly protein W
VQNTNGTLSGVHPVDQQVALALFIELGSIPSAPEIGSKLRTVLSRTDPQQAYQTALDEVNRALALLYAQKAITLLSFALDQSTPGRSILAIGYTNLLDPRYNPNNPALSNTGSVGVAGNRTLTGSA